MNKMSSETRVNTSKEVNKGVYPWEKVVGFVLRATGIQPVPPSPGPQERRFQLKPVFDPSEQQLYKNDTRR